MQRCSPTAISRAPRPLVRTCASSTVSCNRHFLALECMSGQSKPRLGLGELSSGQRRHISSHGRPMFETVTGTAAHQQHVLPAGMAIDDEVAVGAVLIL